MAFWFQINAVNHVIHLLPERYTASSSEIYNFLIGNSSRQTTTKNCLFECFVLGVSKHLGMKRMVKQCVWVGTQGLLELWYDLIWGNKISDAGRA